MQKLSKKRPEKSLVKFLGKTGGRNRQGKKVVKTKPVPKTEKKVEKKPEKKEEKVKKKEEKKKEAPKTPTKEVKK